MASIFDSFNWFMVLNKRSIKRDGTETHRQKLLIEIVYILNIINYLEYIIRSKLAAIFKWHEFAKKSRGRSKKRTILIWSLQSSAHEISARNTRYDVQMYVRLCLSVSAFSIYIYFSILQRLRTDTGYRRSYLILNIWIDSNWLKCFQMNRIYCDWRENICSRHLNKFDILIKILK